MESRKFFELFILISLLCLSGCGKGGSKISRVSEKKSAPEQVIESFALTQTSEGEKEWELQADRAEIYEKEGKTIFQKLKVKFYDQGRITSTLSAREGEIHSSSGDMKVKGDVVVISSDDKTTLRTESLRWDRKRKKIVTDDLVRQEKGDTVITGQGLESDPDLEKVVIKRNVKVIRRLTEQDE